MHVFKYAHVLQYEPDVAKHVHIEKVYKILFVTISIFYISIKVHFNKYHY